MQQFSKVRRPIKFSTKPIVQQPQTSSEPISSSKKPNKKIESPSKTTISLIPFEPIIMPQKPTLYTLSPEEQVEQQTRIAEKQLKNNVPKFQKLVKEAEELGITDKTVQPFKEKITYIEQTEAISQKNIDVLNKGFSFLETAVQTKKAILELAELINKAISMNQAINIKPFQSYVDSLINEINLKTLIDNKDLALKKLTEFRNEIALQPLKSSSLEELKKELEKTKLTPEEEFLEQKITIEPTRKKEPKKPLIFEEPTLEKLKKDLKKMNIEAEREFPREKTELALAQEVAEKKAAQEQAKKAEEKLKKEVDQLYEQIEKEFNDEQKAEQERIAREAQIKEIEQEQKKAAANKAEQQKLLNEIAKNEAQLEEIEREQLERQKKQELLKKEWQEKELALNEQIQKTIEADAAQQKIESTQRRKELEKVEAEALQAKKEALEAEQHAQAEQNKLDDANLKLQQAQNSLEAKQKLEAELAELKNKHQSVQQKMKDAKADFMKQKEKIESQTKSELHQVEQDKTTKIQEAQNNLKKTQDFINKSAEEQTIELDRLEKKYKEETHIQQQSIEARKNEQLKRINEKYEHELKSIEVELEQFIKQQAEAEKIKKQQEKEREEEEKKEAETKQKEEKVKGDGGSNIPQTIINEQAQETKAQETEEKSTDKKTQIPVTPQKEIPLVPTQEEPQISAVVLPQITPEIISGKQKKEVRPITEEPIYQPTEQQAQSAGEYRTPSFAGRTSGTTPRWPSPTFSPYSRPTKAAPFMPSVPYGGSTSSTPESVGWTSPNEPITPYTQRIEVLPRVAPQEKTTLLETKAEQKAQAQEKVWWEKMLPKWIVEYLGRKDRSIQQKAIEEKTEPISPIEEKPIKKETGIVGTIIESIKKPITNAISYIRALFYG